MDWPTVTLLGTCGGAIVQLIDLAAAAKAWQEARHQARIKRRTSLPSLALYIDVPADSLVFLTRLALGALAGLVFHGQVDSFPAAIAVGASAPALFRQLGSFRRVGDAIDEGTGREPVASDGLGGVTTVVAEEK